MLQSSLFKNHFVGTDGFIWWVGQVASEVSWKENIPGVPQEGNDTIKGFAERYRVAIMGYQPHDKEEIKDEELLWATVMYPVTAGGGGRSSSQSCNIVQGSMVYGFFLDGEEAQNPVIMGILGNNEYQAIAKELPEDSRYIPYSGFVPEDYVPYYSQLKTKGGGELVPQTETESNGGEQTVPGEQAGEPINDKVTEAVTGSCAVIDTASDYEAQEQGQPLAEPVDCEPVPTGKIQKEIQNIMVEIQKVQKSVFDYQYAVQNQVSDIEEKIEALVAKAAKFIAGAMKSIFTEIEKFAIEALNNTMKDTYFLLFPNERPELKKAVETTNDMIACLFRNLISGLEDQMLDLMKEATSKVVDASPEMITGMVGQNLGQVTGGISESINQGLSGVSGLTGMASSFSGDVVGQLNEILSYLSCEENPECNAVNEWNILSGPGKLPKGDMSALNAAAKQSSAEESESIFDNPDLNVGPKVCGPPEIQFFGGKGASGNLIISNTGEVMGIDMKSSGTNYSNKSYARVYDKCGKGKGAVVRPIIGNYTDDNDNIQTGVLDVEVIESGTKYLSAPDGSRGHNQYTWSNPDDTFVKRVDNSYTTPTPPGHVIVVNEGDQVFIPSGTVVVTEPQPGGDSLLVDSDTEQVSGITEGVGGGETIVGGKLQTLEYPGVLTTPRPDISQLPKRYPSESTGSYAVILYLCDIIIEESGINYSPGDTLVIEPNVNAVAVPKFDDMGRLTSVKVTESGEGFVEYPKLYIKSATGYNAVLRPKLCIDRIGNDDLKEPTSQDKVLTVIDCVGRV